MIDILVGLVDGAPAIGEPWGSLANYGLAGLVIMALGIVVIRQEADKARLSREAIEREKVYTTERIEAERKFSALQAEMIHKYRDGLETSNKMMDTLSRAVDRLSGGRP